MANWKKILVIYLTEFLAVAVSSYFYFYLQSELIFFVILFLALFVSYFSPFLFKIFFGAKSYNGQYRQLLLGTAKWNNILLKDVFVYEGEGNAVALGYGANKIIAFSKVILENHPQEEIEAVMTHELGHFVNKDIKRGAVVAAVVFSIIAWANAKIVADISILLLMSFLFSAIILLISLSLNRWREREADKYVKKKLKNPAVLAEFLEKVIKEKKEKSFHRFSFTVKISNIFQTHPSVHERIKFLKN